MAHFAADLVSSSALLTKICSGAAVFSASHCIYHSHPEAPGGRSKHTQDKIKQVKLRNTMLTNETFIREQHSTLIELYPVSEGIPKKCCVTPSLEKQGNRTVTKCCSLLTGEHRIQSFKKNGQMLHTPHLASVKKALYLNDFMKMPQLLMGVFCVYSLYSQDFSLGYFVSGSRIVVNIFFLFKYFIDMKCCFMGPI